MNRPEKTEYNEYYETYTSLVPETEIVPALEGQIADVQNVFAAIDEEKGAYSYAEGKWTIKQLLGHLIDTEKIFAYRALRIARADKTPIEGFEQDGYIENGNFNKRNLSDLTEEFLLLRRTNLYFFKNLDEAAWLRTGTASDFPFSVRALAYISAGHVRHHLNILKTRYLAQ
jgi:hypothetical protein